MLLSQKQKIFCENFIACLQYTQNSVHFEKKDQIHRLLQCPKALVLEHRSRVNLFTASKQC